MAYDKATVRAFRPSQFIERQEADEDLRNERLANLAIYVQRAQNGLPLFDAPGIKLHREAKKA